MVSFTPAAPERRHRPSAVGSCAGRASPSRVADAGLQPASRTGIQRERTLKPIGSGWKDARAFESLYQTCTLEAEKKIETCTRQARRIGEFRRAVGVPTQVPLLLQAVDGLVALPPDRPEPHTRTHIAAVARNSWREMHGWRHSQVGARRHLCNRWLPQYTHTSRRSGPVVLEGV